ncbi:MAG: single-stranded-DNA-specific exonuclease RecJ [Bacteroidetes bacterium]|nr:single-stranded-DNA-specific exonuclease RecJ [Bacteroidota bacterium]
MKKRWKYLPETDPVITRQFAGELNIDEPLTKLLLQRGINNFEKAKAFFRPSISHLHDPFLMADMDKAIDRIQQAIANQEKILVYGDYDVDGTSAVALVFAFFSQIYHQMDFYIPDRYSEGYGISTKGIDFAAENGFRLIIALDCGIKSVEKVRYAREKQIDFIICDHHLPGAEIPEAYAILDPKKPNCNYPYKELSGCGIGFKLIQAFAQRANIPSPEIEKYLDLVAISIASDIVDITGENRILAYFGLKLINTRPRPGIEAILEVSRVEKAEIPSTTTIYRRELTISDLVFMIGPRINAAGRIESGRSSVDLLKCEDREESKVIAQQINNNNIERKNLDAFATQQAIDMIRSDEELMRRKTTVVYSPDWHKGVIGIVASRLTESFFKPTIVFTLSNGLYTGSARSVKDFDIYEAVDACSEYLEHFGGHKFAAGLSLKPENYASFREKFEKFVTDKLGDTELIPEIDIDGEIDLKIITQRFIKHLKLFAPFGPGNMSPTFSTRRVKDSGTSRLVKNNHLKLDVFQPDKSSYPISGIAFQQGHFYEEISKGELFDICYHVEENEWQGKVTPQINVKDIRLSRETEE